MRDWQKAYGTDWDLIIKVSVTVLAFVAGIVGLAVLIFSTHTHVYHP